MRSASRFGSHDLGVNARRVEAFMARLQELGAANTKTQGYRSFVVGIEINIPCKK